MSLTFPSGVGDLRGKCLLGPELGLRRLGQSFVIQEGGYEVSYRACRGGGVVRGDG